jgi:hypothetical protein
MIPRDEIVQQVLSLNAEDRACVADVLEPSLSGEAFATLEIAAAWATENERCSATYAVARCGRHSWTSSSTACAGALRPIAIRRRRHELLHPSGGP